MIAQGWIGNASAGAPVEVVCHEKAVQVRTVRRRVTVKIIKPKPPSVHPDQREELAL